MRFLRLAAMLSALIPGVAPAQQIRGIDASFHAALRDAGVAWRDASGAQRPLPEIASAAGANLVRLRVWNSEPAGAYSPEATAAEAAHWRAAGFRILLDFHYSDAWADPGNQAKPAEWASLSGEPLRAAVRDFSRRTVAACAAAGASPDFVQIGNEITGGMLWDDGRVGGEFDTPGQWDALAGLLAAGAEGCREGTPPDRPAPRILLHTDRGGDAAGALWFHRNLAQRGVDFDAIALSYYPFYHGELPALAGTMAALAAEFPQPILVVETGYPWTLGWQDDTHNLVGSPGQLHPGFPASAEGQRDFLMALRATAAAEPRCLGFVYWSPEWIVGGPGGSAWENAALFGADARALPAWEAFAAPPACSWTLY